MRQQQPLSSSRTGIIDCFAGIGGFAHALTDPRFGYHLALTIELDAAARHVYQASFPSHAKDRFVTNIRQLTYVTTAGRMPTAEQAHEWETAGMPDNGLTPATDRQILDALEALAVDPAQIFAVVGGFPCQPWSQSGGDKQPGVTDKVRGTLFADIVRLIEVVQPDLALLENVPNLSGKRHRDWFTTILERLRAAGYSISDDELLLSPDRLAPEHGGTPQIRKRLLFAGRRMTPEETASDPDAARRGIDIDSLLERFTWDPAQWDPEEICDPDDSFDVTPYRLAARESTWITAWNALLQALPCDELPMELYADTFSPTFQVPDGTHPAAAARMRRSHAFYLTQRPACDAWTQRTWPLDGRSVRAADFPATRRILEWQARSAQPASADRDLWQCTFSMRSSGIRVRPLTSLPALVALNTTSAIGPRGRYITPREAARLQGMPVAVWEPDIPAIGAKRAPRPDLDSCPPARQLLPVAVTDADALRAAAERVSDLWWKHGGYTDLATGIALRESETTGCTPGEILLAAAALAARQARWRGSGLRWSDLAWDAYRTLASSADPIAFDPSLAAVDWRVRRSGTIAAARAAGASLQDCPTGADALEWFALHVDVRLPSAGETWDDRACDLATAVRAFKLDAAWLRALHRSALLARWDDGQFPLEGLRELDEALIACGVADAGPAPVPGTALAAHAGHRARQAPVAEALRLPRPGAGSRNSGAGMATTLLPLTRATLEQGRARLEQTMTAWAASEQRAGRLAGIGQSDPRTDAAIHDAKRQYVLAAFDLRRHRSLAPHLRRAGYVCADLYAQTARAGIGDQDLADAALACVEAWARYQMAPPNGPLPVMLLPEVPDTAEPPAWLEAIPAVGSGIPWTLLQADATVAISASIGGTAGLVMAAHYERQRTLTAYLSGKVRTGEWSMHDADQVAMALTRRAGLHHLVADLMLTAEYATRNALAPMDWAALTRSAASRVEHGSQHSAVEEGAA